MDLKSGAFEPRAVCPDFLRGLAFHRRYAIVGLSPPRDGTSTGLELDDELKKRDAEPKCAVQVIDLRSGDIVQWIRQEGGVTGLFDICTIPGVRRPLALGFLSDETHQNITVEFDRPEPADATQRTRGRPGAHETALRCGTPECSRYSHANLRSDSSSISNNLEYLTMKLRI